jgi:hypothetical protein
MEGAALAAKRKQECDIVLAWHTAAFTGATQTKKGLGPLSKYIAPASRPRAQTATEMLGVLKEFKSRGAGMSIRRVN